ncbi:UbiH/UbiF family hydroxylase [Mesorhizobium koreense]|uniref:UbiH/UbiF family hydroxylase n=1 Tax=Mesorhizobium koreense TaxID=3074855 RepID=UPI00287B7AF7|nr:UbiH/UbiF family hydroxylase [Mesorhizobium sp. WR6]
MAETNSSEILVAGAGPAGMIAALAFAGNGFSITLAGPPAPPDDRRTTALMMPSLALLKEFGLFDVVAESGAPLRAMRIVDGTSRLIRSPTVTFRASEIGETAFGYNIPNRHLLNRLEAAVREHGAIEWRESLVSGYRLSDHEAVADLDGDTITARLVVAADGRSSPAREAAGIHTHRHGHPQSALVLNFAHSRDHGNVSTEFHTETGPFTQVPLPGQRSSLVWVVRPEAAERLMEMSNNAISEEIEGRMQSMLGKVEVEPGRQVYPLSSAMPSRFGARRVALVGEAAHLFPPIGAQGLNLGVRDIQDLVTIARASRGDPGSPAALLRYDARRRPDIMARSSAVNMLNYSLLSDFLPAQFMRSAGIGLLAGFAPLRGFFMREGLRPGSGWRHAFGGRVTESGRPSGEEIRR